MRRGYQHVAGRSTIHIQNPHPGHQETQGLATQQHRLVGHWVHHQLHCSIRGVLSHRLAVEDLAAVPEIFRRSRQVDGT